MPTGKPKATNPEMYSKSAAAVKEPPPKKLPAVAPPKKKPKKDEPLLEFADLSAGAQAILTSTGVCMERNPELPTELIPALKRVLEVAKHTRGVIHAESQGVYMLCLKWRLENG